MRNKRKENIWKSSEKGRGSGGRSDLTPQPLESSGSVSASLRPEQVLWESHAFATSVNYRTGEVRQPLGSTQKPPVSLLLPYGQSSLLQPECALKNVNQNTSHTHIHTLAQNSPRLPSTHVQNKIQIPSHNPPRPAWSYHCLWPPPRHPPLPPSSSCSTHSGLGLSWPQGLYACRSLCLDMALPTPVATRLAFLLKLVFAQMTPTRRGILSPQKSKNSPAPLQHFPVPSLALFSSQDSPLSENVLHIKCLSIWLPTSP